MNFENSRSLRKNRIKNRYVKIFLNVQFSFFGRVTPIWGYKELALDDTHALGLIERESKDMELFLKRKAEIDEFEAL
ncbi:hypothetical protein COK00_23120 [Bacillus cereus]|uniref:Uncharacterized protein n=1 Tax=Bacillus cereus TaxID=1396 RepID=A0A2B1IA68_BACCE|nr:hypothetical protein [Bacillus cereus]PEX40006.1 hypothetical protein CN455_05000 [Bacillus cereus]PFB17997.1 hypothetical protein CN399_05805 [Bacillus cereus]PFC71117.1 hypothetical protein CN290_23945 [Bacillus cereus]PFK31121.1 hypothetical protein COJ18_25400 [Bacillus cereus]PFM97139.1 hypothetical protein COJ65_28865 [Bacillus cereus]